MTNKVFAALERPVNYAHLPEKEKWQIDKDLGILDWVPTEEEIDDLDRHWKIKLQEHGRALAKKYADMEEELGTFPPGGASGGVVARQRRRVENSTRVLTMNITVQVDIPIPDAMPDEFVEKLRAHLESYFETPINGRLPFAVESIGHGLESAAVWALKATGVWTHTRSPAARFDATTVAIHSPKPTERDYEVLGDVTLSPEDSARAEAAIEQAEKDIAESKKKKE